MLDKAQILQAILDRLTVEFESHQATSKMTRAASNDAETKSEGKYDTRSTEENYLADGLAKKALVAAQAAKAYRDLSSEKFDPNQAIDLGALVELSFECAGELVTVVTRGSPLGNQIYGKKVGDLTAAPKAKIESIQ
jgi:hypothetical protein